MDTQRDIRQKLLAGKDPLDLIVEGYSRSSVYFELRKIRDQVPVPAPDVEPAGRGRHEEVLKLEKEMADAEAAKQELSDRVAALEQEVVALRSLIRNAVNAALLAVLRELVDEKAAKEYAEGWVQRNIENLIDKAGKA